MARALLTAAYVPRQYWTDAVVTAFYLLNRMPSRVLAFNTPLQCLAHHTPLPFVLMLPPRTFGCVAYVHLHKNRRIKLDPCVVRCIFLGYATHKKGYRCYDPTTRRLYTTMDVTFLESKTFFPKQATHSSLQGEILSEEQNWVNWPGFEDTSSSNLGDYQKDDNTPQSTDTSLEENMTEKIEDAETRNE